MFVCTQFSKWLETRSSDTRIYGTFVRCEVLTAVSMKNAVFWDIQTQFITHRRHITSALQSLASYRYIWFEVFTAVNMKNAVFWDLRPCGSCKNITRTTRPKIPEDGILYEMFARICCYLSIKVLNGVWLYSERWFMCIYELRIYFILQ
jgi:hypothetical protein